MAVDARLGPTDDRAVVGIVEERELSEPDWSYYRELHHVCLWQAAALKHNIDPGEFQIPPDDVFKVELMPSEVKRTLSIVQNHADKSLPLVGPPEKNEYSVVSEFCEVELKYFALWAEAKDRRWTLPPEFPRFSPAELEAIRRKHGLPSKQIQRHPVQAIGPVENKESSAVTISLPHTTANLEAIFKVMRDNWTKYDPDNPPKQTAIARKLDEALGWGKSSDGGPSRSAQQVAALIRPDKLSEADKRASIRRARKS